ncbi:MAG: bacillithiol biosynthesis deacetylase BshB1 [Planctomycetaceae bacterium]|nr:bacillithiol biosynthesis deacetylase BshB1 [Planctomycetaceae bacterium]
MTSIEQPLDALIVAPHPDDAELGMGGGILTMLGQGLRVGVLDLTDGEPTPFGSLEIRARETAAATKLLGLSWRSNLGLPNRSLEPTLAAREALAGVIRLTRPRWLFAPFWEDAHPDHVAATRLIEDARFWAKLSKTNMPGQPHHPERVFHYYCVHLRAAIQPMWILDISQHWAKKRAAIECFHSQFIANRSERPSFADRLEEEAGYWGRLIGARYGEPYTCREPLGLRGFSEVM